MFANELTVTTDENGNKTEEVNGVNFIDVSYFILALVVPSYIKRNFKFIDETKHSELSSQQSKAFRTYETFYECLYRYSHKRLESALAIPSVS